MSKDMDFKDKESRNSKIGIYVALQKLFIEDTSIFQIYRIVHK